MDQPVYRCGDFELDAANRRFVRAGVEQLLEPKVFAVLLQLMMRPGELLLRDRLLDAVWGHRYVTPSTLNRVIGLARRALGDDSDQPRFIQTVHGAGYRFVGPVQASATSAAEPRARFRPHPSVRPPARLQALIGREQELSRMESLLADGRALTLLGSGGMGKTQCALAFAHEQAAHYRDGVWFFDLAPLQRADQWLQALAGTLSIAPADSHVLVDKISQLLVGRSALLLLDNCDRLSGEVGALVVELLRGTDQLKVLATSQQQLNFVGERVLRLPPLRLPEIRRPEGSQELREVAAAPAVELLLSRIRDAQPEFVLSAANAPAIVDICERLDGMPLALELAAARFALLSPAQVVERLDQRFRFLVSDVAGRDPRHRTLVELLEWSFRLLSPSEQRFLAWLGVCVQGWSVEAAIAIGAAFGSSPENVVDLLAGLSNKSLVSVDQSVTPPRYRLLESVREFALGKLAAMGEERRARDAHLGWVQRMVDAAHADMLGGRMRERIPLLEQEHGNIESALYHALGAAQAPQDALRVAGLLMLYCKAHGAVLWGLGLADLALGRSAPGRTRERAQAQMCRGVIGVMLIRRFDPEVPLAEAAAIAGEVGDRWSEAYSSAYLAMWFAHIGQVERCAGRVETAERIAEELDDPTLRAVAGLARGWWQLAQDEIDEAIAGMRTIRGLGDDFHQHHFVDMYIGLGLFRRGDYAAAAAQWYEAMRAGAAVGHLRGVAGSIEGCGYLAVLLGRPEEACRCLAAAERIRARTQIPLFSFWHQHNAAARAALGTRLGPQRFEAAMRAGARMRDEDAVNEAGLLLREFASGAAAGQEPAKVPLGS